MFITSDDFFNKNLPFIKKIFVNLIKRYERYQRYKDSPNYTLEELYNLYIVSEPKRNNYLRWSYNVLPIEMKQMKFKDIPLITWQEEINKLIKKHQAISTQKRMKSLYSQLCDFAIKLDMDVTNEIDKLEVEKKIQVSNKVPFTLWEIQQLWKYVPDNKEIQDILILIYTGLRISEYLNLTIDDIHLDKRYFIVTKSKTKSGRNRYVPIHKDIIPFLKEKISIAQLFDGYIARDMTTKVHYNYWRFSTKFKKVLRYMCFKHTIHECRHTFITLLDVNEVPVIVIKKIVGHAPDDLTGKVYTHVLFSDIIKAIDKLKGKRLVKEKIKHSNFI